MGDTAALHGRHRRPGLRAAVVLLLVTTALAVAANPSPVAAAEGLDVSAEVTYTFDPAAPAVRVQQVIRLTNTVPDRREGNVINRAYFTGFTLTLPRGAQNITATANGRVTTITATPHESDEFLIAEVEFSRNLFHRSTETLDVRFDLLGSEPRSDDAARVNAAYAAFDVFGYADPGQLDVTVVMPRSYEVDQFGDRLGEDRTDDLLVLSAVDVAEPETFYTFVTVRDDQRLTSTKMKASGATFDVRAWPGDTRWEQFVTRTIEKAVPALENALGQDWPLEDRVEVREAYTPYFYGYAGWFNAETGELEIGEDLDRELVVHELSHAWFNRDRMGERWMSEGMAQSYAAIVVRDLGGKVRTAEEPERKRFELLGWDSPRFSVQSDETRADEEFGYAASWWVIESLIDEIGEDAMRDVFAAIENDETAYVGEGRPESEPSSQGIDWKRLLDLADERGGATGFDETLAEWVLTEEDAEALEEREGARDSLVALESQSGAWATPYGVRRAMGNWSFVRAEQQMAAAHEILDARDALAEAAEAIDVEPLADYETEYQEAIDVDELDLVDRMEADAAAAERVAEVIAAEAEDDGFFGNLGLRDEDLLTPLTEAREAVAAGDPETAVSRAEEVQAVIDGAEQEGKDIVTRWAIIAGSIVLGLLVLLILVVVLRRRRRRRRAAEAAAAAPLVATAPADTAENTEATTDDDLSAADWLDQELAGPTAAEPTATGPDVTEPTVPDQDGAGPSTV